MARTVMFVDDERQILKALNRLFVDSPYETVFMESGEEALKHLESNAVDLIISDIRMPGMSGFELLKAVKERYPKVMRVALSGYTDSRNIYKALEENIAKMYLFKPWDNKELMRIVDRMFELESTLNDPTLMEYINNISDLPTMPELYSRIRSLIAEDADVDRIAKAIEMDQASATRVLRIANSAFFGAKTGSISQAIMYIGLINVKSIVLSNSIFKFKGRMEKEIEQLWSASTLTNRFCSLFYQDMLKKRIPNVYASAGLLSNIGMVVLLSQHNEKYETTLFHSLTERVDILKLERDTFGITHEELGSYLLNWWEIPLPIVEAALYHHDPADSRIINRELVSVVHLCNYYAWKRLGDKQFIESVSPAVFECLGVSQSDADAYFKEADVTLDR